MYVVNAAADIAGSKRNFILEFPYPPNFAELVARCEGVFTWIRPHAEFITTNMQLYEDATGAWSTVNSMKDVVEGGQLYLFEADSWQTDMQQQIPPPEHPPAAKQAGSRPTTPALSAAATPRLAHLTEAPLLEPQHHASAAALPPAETTPALRPAAASLHDSYSLHDSFDTLQKAETRDLPQSIYARGPAADIIASAPLPVAVGVSAGLGLASKGVSPVKPAREVVPEGFDLQRAYAAVAPLAYHNSVSHSEKLSYTYRNLINRHTGVVQMEDWVAASRQLGIPLTIDAIRSLFVRADANQDGVLASGEWGMLAEMYPALLESLYFRMRDDEEQAIFEDRLRDAKVQLNVSVSAAQGALEGHRQAQQRVQDLESRLHTRDISIDERRQKHRDVEASHREYCAVVAKAQEEKAVREAEMRQQVDRHNAVVTAVNQRVDESDEAGRRHAAQRENLAFAENSLIIAEEQVGAALEGVQSGAGQLEGQTHDRLQRTAVLRDQEDALEQAVREAAACSDAMAHLTLCGQQLESAEADQLAIVSRLTHIASQAEAECHQHATAYNEAVKLVTDMEQRVVLAEAETARSANAVTTLTTEYTAYTHRRHMVEEQEKPLVEEELRLREKRFHLEHREQQLVDRVPHG